MNGGPSCRLRALFADSVFIIYSTLSEAAFKRLSRSTLNCTLACNVFKVEQMDKKLSGRIAFKIVFYCVYYTFHSRTFSVFNVLLKSGLKWTSLTVADRDREHQNIQLWKALINHFTHISASACQISLLLSSVFSTPRKVRWLSCVVTVFPSSWSNTTLPDSCALLTALRSETDNFVHTEHAAGRGLLAKPLNLPLTLLRTAYCL